MAKFKVGDKVRILDVRSIGYSWDLTEGAIYEVLGKEVGGENHRRHNAIIVRDDAGDDFSIADNEYHAIEKVEPDTPKYSIVKREAIVGERILVGDKSDGLGHYHEGDILTVCRKGPRGVYAEELEDIPGGNFFIGPSEYEVILEEAPPNRKTDDRISALEAEIETLKAQVYTLEKNKANTPSLAQVISGASPNYRRKDAIERAKSFVANVNDRTHGSVNSDGNRLFNVQATKLSFHVNTEKRIVTALAHGAGSGRLRGKAFAKCAPGDVFNADVGKAIAAGRLYGFDVSEFERAVQPSGAVAGMRIEGASYELPECRGVRTCYGSDGSKVYTYASKYGWYYAPYVTILDDTEAQY